MVRKMINILIVGFLMMVFAFLVTGCSCKFNPKNYWLKSGDFLYTAINDNQDVVIKNLSDEGEQKEIIVVPEFIDGKKVVSLGLVNIGLPNYQWKSEKLKRLYIPYQVSNPLDSLLRDCPNLEKVMVCYTESIFDCYTEFRFYLPNIDSNTRYFYENSSDNCYPANVSFMWNYADANNNGFYWIDDLDYGEKISFLPIPPEREGYTFEGWYKEPSCLNKWDFDIDTLPTSQFENDGQTVIYQETKLYAKWVEI